MSWIYGSSGGTGLWDVECKSERRMKEKWAATYGVELKAKKDAFDTKALAPPPPPQQPPAGATGITGPPNTIEHNHTITIAPADPRTVRFSEFLSASTHGALAPLSNERWPSSA